MAAEVAQSGAFSNIYHYQTGGGAITTDKIRYSKQFFNGGSSDDVYSWLRLSSHEVGHIPQYDAVGDDSKYIDKFIGEYASNLGHDNVPMEIEADKGRTEFDSFIKSVGFKAIREVFESNSTDNEKSDNLISLYQTHLRTQVETHLNTLQSMDINAPDFEQKSGAINNQIQSLQQKDNDLEEQKSYNAKTIPRR